MRSRFVTVTSSPEGPVLHGHPEEAAQPAEPIAGRSGGIQYVGRSHRQVKVTVRTRPDLAGHLRSRNDRSREDLALPAQPQPHRHGVNRTRGIPNDHEVALSDAWQKGAQGWDTARRTVFANNPLNLLAVDGPRNMQRATPTPPPGCPQPRMSRQDPSQQDREPPTSPGHIYDLRLTPRHSPGTVKIFITLPGRPTRCPITAT